MTEKGKFSDSYTQTNDIWGMDLDGYRRIYIISLLGITFEGPGLNYLIDSGFKMEWVSTEFPVVIVGR